VIALLPSEAGAENATERDAEEPVIEEIVGAVGVVSVVVVVVAIVVVTYVSTVAVSPWYKRRSSGNEPSYRYGAVESPFNVSVRRTASKSQLVGALVQLSRAVSGVIEPPAIVENTAGEVALTRLVTMVVGWAESNEQPPSPCSTVRRTS
jgi:hypothetical protein